MSHVDPGLPLDLTASLVDRLARMSERAQSDSLSSVERERAAAEALASVRLEGLDPTAVEPVLAAWSAGEITTDQMIEQAQALAAGKHRAFPAHAA